MIQTTRIINPPSKCIRFIAFAMPKKSKNVLKETKTEDTSPVGVDKSGNIIIKVHAKPGAKLNSITEILPDAIGVQINAPPVEGEANTELIKYISSVLGIRKSDITLDRGSRSREKTLLVSKGVLNQEEILQKLKSEAKN